MILRVAVRCFALLALCCGSSPAAETPPALSGIHPHLAMFNDEGECGTGVVVPWAGHLWVITYAPHKPIGSSDKLYEITPDLRQIIRPESVGGTPANRMIHRESQQLIIGPYVIDGERSVRVLPPDKMFGRITGNARHLTDPTHKIYYATMEEGVYEVELKTLAVTERWADEQRQTGRHANLPGYHGKGLYSGQGRLIYANNGDHAKEALSNPAVPSGVLAWWDGRSEAWQIIRRNQFTEVTGPGGIFGNEHPATDPVWSIGWDHRSLLLMLLDGGQWRTYRLPKASHTYDGAHGWNTEWPRIRDIGAEGQPDLLMTMHGMFWRFPNTFSATNAVGLVPRSTYLKVIGDFCRWQDKVVLGCDDTAKNEFLNKRKAKGNLAGPGQSQSNLQFVDPSQLDHFGPLLGRGAVWVNDPVEVNEVSDAFLFAGFNRRALHLAQDAATQVTFTIEVDGNGQGSWRRLREITVPSGGRAWTEFAATETGAWVRLRANRAAPHVTAMFHYGGPDERPRHAAPLFDGVATLSEQHFSSGVIRARSDNLRTLNFAATTVRDGRSIGEGHYELDAAMHLRRVKDASAHEWLKKNAAIPAGVLQSDAASVLFLDDAGRRWRLPKGSEYFDVTNPWPARVCREACTERDLFNAHGTFYELPAENAGGFAKIRPITTHNRRITDYCSYRGLLILSGVSADAPAGNRHIIRSEDGQVALWAGAVDDLWQFGKAVGHGGPWKNSVIKSGQPSDAYLMTGYDHKTLTLSHHSDTPVAMRVEVDITGGGDWETYRTFDVPAGQELQHVFPDTFQSYWVRLVADHDGRATAWFVYD